MRFPSKIYSALNSFIYPPQHLGFLPTNICTVRTIKADLICGLEEGQSDTLNKASPNWMVTGEYGVIQFCERNDCSCFLEVLKRKTLRMKEESEAKKETKRNSSVVNSD